MRVLAINTFHVNYNQKQKAELKATGSIVAGAPVYSGAAVVAPYFLNFGQIQEKRIKDLRCIPDLPCAFCGEQMISNEVYRKLSEEESKAKAVFRILRPEENKIHGHFKNVYDTLKEEAKKYPDKTIQEIINEPAFKIQHLIKLQMAQDATLSSVLSIALKLSPGSQKKVLDTVLETRKIIYDPDEETNKRRKVIIKKFNGLELNKNEQEIKNKIIRQIERLPASTTNESAFFVKYSRRSSAETMQNMIQGFCATKEHVVPKNNTDGDDGSNDWENLIIACQCCNGHRGQIPYKEMIENNPEIPANMQKYIDKVAFYYNSKMLSDDFINYPKDIKKTLYDNSDGLIRLYTAMFKKPEEIYSKKHCK